MNSIATPPTANLWTRARASFARAVAEIGMPVVIAAATLSKTLRREIVDWLYPLENIVRRLLLADAAELRRAEMARTKCDVRVVLIPLQGMAQTWSAGLPTRACTATVRRMSEDSRSIDCANPQSWRANFSFALPHNNRLVPNSRAPRIRDPWADTPPPPPAHTPRALKREHAPFRLARRFEVLRRVLENPAPHAMRLARLLAREVRRFSAVVHRAVLRGARTDSYDPADSRLSLDALGAAWDAPEAFKDTS